MHHRPSNSLQIPRFGGIRTFMRLPHRTSLDDVDLAVIGVPTDSAVGFRSGARFGPEAIRSASVLLREYNQHQQVNVADALSMVDAGDAPTVPGYHELTLERVERHLRPMYEAGVVPAVLGGDHSLVMAELRAAASVHGPLSVVHFDAHGDVLDDYFGVKHFHGTMFRRAVEEGLVDPARSVQAGMRGSLQPGDEVAGADLGYRVVWWDELRDTAPSDFGDLVRARVGARPTIVSFDIDVVDPAHAPGTGTPEVGGPSSDTILRHLRSLAGLEIVGFDVVEVAPAYDHGEITSMLAATVCFELMSLVARR